MLGPPRRNQSPSGLTPTENGAVGTGVPFWFLPRRDGRGHLNVCFKVSAYVGGWHGGQHGGLEATVTLMSSVFFPRDIKWRWNAQPFSGRVVHILFFVWAFLLVRLPLHVFLCVCVCVCLHTSHIPPLFWALFLQGQTKKQIFISISITFMQLEMEGPIFPLESWALVAKGVVSQWTSLFMTTIPLPPPSF